MAVKRWRGPDLLVIGWIPFHVNPPVALGYPPDRATTLLFQSGNPRPPVAFDGYRGFADWLHPKSPVGTKEYRAALYLEGVAAEFPDSGMPRADRTANGSFIGYTPLRLFIGGVNVAAMFPQFAQYTKGTGPLISQPGNDPVTQVADPSGTWVQLRYRAEFKLSWLVNALSRVLVHSWAPYAWCEISYRFYDSGRITIRVLGSAIPSQRLYVDWARPAAAPAAGIVPEYDMLSASLAEVVGFIQTLGWGCQPAPGTTRLAWNGMASPW